MEIFESTIEISRLESDRDRWKSMCERLAEAVADMDFIRPRNWSSVYAPCIEPPKCKTHASTHMCKASKALDEYQKMKEKNGVV